MIRQIILILCCLAGLSACAHDDRPALPDHVLPPTGIGQSLPASH